MSKINLTDLTKRAGEFGVETGPFESFDLTCKMKNLSFSTIKCYAERLRYLLDWSVDQGIDYRSLSKLDLQHYLTSQIGQVSVATINGRIAVYNVFFKHLVDEHFIEQNPMTGIEKLRQPKIIKDVLTPEDVSKVLRKLNRKCFHGARDFCMILLTFDAMLRVGELLQIKVSQLNLQDGSMKVYGKGRKERFVAFNPIVAKALHQYLIRYRHKVQGELLFCSMNGSPIDYRRAHNIFSKAGKAAGVFLHPHLARHSGATQFARSGGSLAVLQRALGHSTLAVTERYVHLGDQDILDAYQKHSPANDIRV